MKQLLEDYLKCNVNKYYIIADIEKTWEGDVELKQLKYLAYTENSSESVTLEDLLVFIYNNKK